MHVIQDDLWNCELGKASLILVSCNATVNNNGELVMGRGAAAFVKGRFPGIAEEFGSYLHGGIGRGRGHKGERMLRYGVIVAAPIYVPVTRIGIFQVKYGWWEKADLELIRFSTESLKAIASDWRRIAMNFPGIGNGRLTEEQVLPIIESLPDNVYVYKR